MFAKRIEDIYPNPPAGLAPTDLDEHRVPEHVAVIMDGNGRWAKKHRFAVALGHRAGTENLREIIRHTDDLGIGALSLYAFSTENWRRSTDEVAALMQLILDFFASEIDELDAKNVRILILGDKSAMPPKQRDTLIAAEERTGGNTGLRLNIAINYGGRDEILHAVKNYAEAYKAGEAPELTEENFSALLYTTGIPDPDLIIRTSGEERLSNFLPWQTTYAEFIFDSILWPDFNRERYMKCLREYADRDRRFGGVKTDANGEVQP
jgi:undecaprenyl diphosphate synthase